MTSPDDKRDPKVKDVLKRDATPLEEIVDAETAAELQRWFGLPSFQQLAEEPEREHPVQAEMTDARNRATSHVRPEFLATIARRNEPPESKFKATIEPIEAKLALFDPSMLDHGIVVGGERELEVPESVSAALGENTPQALLRDLHRAETRFDRLYDMVDYGAEQRLDIVEAVRTAMATTWKLPPLDQLPVAMTKLVIDEYRAVRRARWDVLSKPATQSAPVEGESW